MGVLACNCVCRVATMIWDPFPSAFQRERERERESKRERVSEREQSHAERSKDEKQSRRELSSCEEAVERRLFLEYVLSSISEAHTQIQNINI